MDVEGEIRALRHQQAATERHAAALEALLQAVVSHLPPETKARLRSQREALRRRLDAEKPRAGQSHVGDNLRALQVLDEMLADGLAQAPDAPLAIE